MSNYSHALQSVLDAGFEGKQLRLAEKCSVPQSLISRHLTGDFRPDLDSLEKICSALGPELRAKLAVAHLHDETPPSARSHVEILTRDQVKGVYEAGQSMPPALQRLDNKTRRALEFIADLAMDNKDACAAIQSTARFLGADLSRETVAEPELVAAKKDKKSKKSGSSRYEL